MLLLMGRRPHLTVTLLALSARMSQGALLAQMTAYLFWNHASTWFQTMLTQLVSPFRAVRS